MPGPACCLGESKSISHDGCSPEIATIPNPSKVTIGGVLPMLAPGKWHPIHESCADNHCCHPIASVAGHPRVLVDGRMMMFTGGKTTCGVTAGVAKVICKTGV